MHLTHKPTSGWVSPDSSRMLVGATVAAAISLLGYSGFSNSRLQMLETQRRLHLNRLTQNIQYESFPEQPEYSIYYIMI